MTPEWAAIIVSGIVAITVAMIKFAPRKDNPGHNALDKKYVRKDLCDERSEHIADDIGEIKADVKTLLLRER